MILSPPDQIRDLTARGIWGTVTIEDMFCTAVLAAGVAVATVIERL